jgi:hypothetical protein
MKPPFFEFVLGSLVTTVVTMSGNKMSGNKS